MILNRHNVPTVAQLNWLRQIRNFIPEFKVATNARESHPDERARTFFPAGGGAMGRDKPLRPPGNSRPACVAAAAMSMARARNSGVASRQRRLRLTQLRAD